MSIYLTIFSSTYVVFLIVVIKVGFFRLREKNIMRSVQSFLRYRTIIFFKDRLHSTQCAPSQATLPFVFDPY